MVYGKNQVAAVESGHRQANTLTKNHSGFTLIELLVVVTLIALLTAIGISTYAGIQSKGRDTKRRGDIEEIRKAMELYYVGGTKTPYQTPTGTMFSNGFLPQDPKNDSTYFYTFKSTGANSGAITKFPPNGGPFADYVVCAKLENKGGNADQNGGPVEGGDYYCRKNVQ